MWSRLQLPNWPTKTALVPQPQRNVQLVLALLRQLRETYPRTPPQQVQEFLAQASDFVGAMRLTPSLPADAKELALSRANEIVLRPERFVFGEETTRGLVFPLWRALGFPSASYADWTAALESGAAALGDVEDFARSIPFTRFTKALREAAEVFAQQAKRAQRAKSKRRTVVAQEPSTLDCYNEADYVTLDEWDEVGAEEDVVQLWFPDADKPHCFLRSTLRSTFAQPDSVRADWVQKPEAARLDDEGHGGTAGALRFYKLPPFNQWITAEAKATLLSPRHREYRLELLRPHQRMGPVTGQWREPHGRAPGDPVYAVRPKAALSRSPRRLPSPPSSPQPRRRSTRNTRPRSARST